MIIMCVSAYFLSFLQFCKRYKSQRVACRECTWWCSIMVIRKRICLHRFLTRFVFELHFVNVNKLCICVLLLVPNNVVYLVACNACFQCRALPI